MIGNVDWPTLILLVTFAAFVGGVLWAVFNWIYRDNNSMRDRIDKLQDKVAENYVTTEVHRMSMEMIEKSIGGIRSSIDELKTENRAAVDRLTDTFKALITTLKPPSTPSA